MDQRRRCTHRREEKDGQPKGVGSEQYAPCPLLITGVKCMSSTPFKTKWL